MNCGHDFTGQARCGRCDSCFHTCCRCSRLSKVKRETYILSENDDPTTGRAKARIRYLKWWQGKMCRPINSFGDFKLVIDVKTVGTPSFVYGNAYLVYSDGTEAAICTQAFIPRKCDVEIQE